MRSPGRPFEAEAESVLSSWALFSQPWGQANGKPPDDPNPRNIQIPHLPLIGGGHCAVFQGAAESAV